MKKLICAVAILFSSPFCTHTANSTPPPDFVSNEGGIVLFTPPNGWRQADTSLLPPHIKLMVIGKGPSAFPPSMNLNVQSFSGTLKQYLKIVKDTNESQGFEWKDLGTLRTEAGNASLSQFDHKSQWGTIRMMQVILIKNGMVYILSASALKDEFSLFYKDFFASMRSLRVSKTPIEMISSSQQKTQLRNAIQKMQVDWNALLTQNHTKNNSTSPEELKKQTFQSQAFQKDSWIPFKEMLSQRFSTMGPDWQALLLENTESELFESQIK